MNNKKEKLTFLSVFKDELKFNKKSVLIQLLYGIANGVSPFIYICFPPLIIDYLVKKEINKTYLIISLFSLAAIIINILLKYLYAKYQQNNYYLPRQFNKRNIFKSIIIDFKYTEQKDSIEKYNNSLNFCWTCCSIVYDFFSSLITSIIKFALIITILLTLDFYVVLFVIFIVLINYLISTLIIKKNKKYSEERNKIERYTNYYNKILAGLEYGKEKRLYPNIQKLFYDEYEVKTNEIINHDKKVRNYNFIMSKLTSLITFIQNIGIYYMMIYKYSLNQITIGSFFAYIGIANEMYNAFASLVYNSIQLSKFKTYAKAYNEFMEYENVYQSDNLSVEDKDEYIITFENVCFKYPNTEKEVINNVNFTIKPNEKLYLVGENGSGKSTLIKLLLRLYEPTSGEIKLNGVNINKYNYNDYLKLISAIFQDFNLYKISIKDNICFNDFKGKEFEEVINKCDLINVINSLKNKEDTNIDKEYNEDGVELSGGEMQRIAIARALYKNANTYIFDEPTAALDPISEKEILSIFNETTKNKTNIIVSHRMSTASLCDYIILLENGSIVEEGTFDYLMKLKGKFYEQYTLQSKYYK